MTTLIFRCLVYTTFAVLSYSFSTSESHAGQLHDAVNAGDSQIVFRLIEQGADVNEREFNLITPLHLAAIYGKFEIAVMLLAHGANVHATDTDGHTPLHNAAALGYLDIVETLIANGSNIHATSKFGQTALYFAQQNDHTEVISLILSSRKDETEFFEKPPTPDNIENLLSFLLTNDRISQDAAIRNLINLGQPVVSYMLLFLKEYDDDANAIGAIQVVLKGIGKPAVPYMAELLDDSARNAVFDGSVLAVVQALGHIGKDAVEAVPAILRTYESLNDEGKNIFHLAFSRAIEEIIDPQ